MKVALEIPDDLASEALNLARAQGSTLEGLVIVGLRGEVDRLRDAVGTGFQFPTASGEGLVPGLSSQQAILISHP